MHKKMSFLRVFQKIALFSCIFYVFCMPSMVFALPSGYVELEYIAKNNASQYIQTDYVGNLNSRYEGAVYTTSVSGEYDAYYIASRSGSGDTRHIVLGVVKDNVVEGGVGLYVGHGKYVTQGSRLGGAFGKRMDFVTDFVHRTYSVAIDGGITTTKAIPSNAIVTSFTNTAPLQIFFNRVAGTSSTVSYAAPTGTRIYYLKIYENNNLVHHFVPAKRSSDNVIGMYDVVENEFLTNAVANTGSFAAGPVMLPEHCVSGSGNTCTECGAGYLLNNGACVVLPEHCVSDNGVACTACESGYVLNNGACTEQIKIATTKFVDEEFAATEAKLAETVETIEDVVSRTITQTGQIATLQSEKQTRPNETCPAGKKCLLVMDENDIPHWYEIIEPFNAVEFLKQLIKTNGDNYYYVGDSTFGVFGFRSQPPTSSGLRQLNETEWVVQWKDKGAVYGTSVCSGNPGTYGGVSSTEQTETKGKYCWGKVTSVAGIDNVEHDVSGALWGFLDTFSSVADCADYCAVYCADRVQGSQSLRATMFGGVN